MSVNLVSNHHKEKDIVLGGENKGLLLKHLVPTLKHNGGSVMAWGTVSWHGPGVIEKNP